MADQPPQRLDGHERQKDDVRFGALHISQHESHLGGGQAVALGEIAQRRRQADIGGRADLDLAVPKRFLQTDRAAPADSIAATASKKGSATGASALGKLATAGSHIAGPLVPAESASPAPPLDAAGQLLGPCTIAVGKRRGEDGPLGQIDRRAMAHSFRRGRIGKIVGDFGCRGVGRWR